LDRMLSSPSNAKDPSWIVHDMDCQRFSLSRSSAHSWVLPG
jgi:hypothetical protein